MENEKKELKLLYTGKIPQIDGMYDIIAHYDNTIQILNEQIESLRQTLKEIQENSPTSSVGVYVSKPKQGGR